MGSNTVKLIIAQVHIAVGLAAVATLAATGHLDATVAAGFIGGLLGIGAGAPLVAYNPQGPAQALPPGPGPTTTAQAASGAQAGNQGPVTTAETPGEITGTAAGSAMPQAGG